jgi:hypothetical protein
MLVGIGATGAVSQSVTQVEVRTGHRNAFEVAAWVVAEEVLDQSARLL